MVDSVKELVHVEVTGLSAGANSVTNICTTDATTQYVVGSIEVNVVGGVDVGKKARLLLNSKEIGAWDVQSSEPLVLDLQGSQLVDVSSTLDLEITSKGSPKRPPILIRDTANLRRIDRFANMTNPTPAFLVSSLINSASHDVTWRPARGASQGSTYLEYKGKPTFICSYNSALTWIDEEGNGVGVLPAFDGGVGYDLATDGEYVYSPAGTTLHRIHLATGKYDRLTMDTSVLNRSSTSGGFCLYHNGFLYAKGRTTAAVYKIDLADLTVTSHTAPTSDNELYCACKVTTREGTPRTLITWMSASSTTYRVYWLDVSDNSTGEVIITNPGTNTQACNLAGEIAEGIGWYANLTFEVMVDFNAGVTPTVTYPDFNNRDSYLEPSVALVRDPHEVTDRVRYTVYAKGIQVTGA